MINLSERSVQKELLDADDIPFADIRQNLKELDLINSKLGGHAVSISAVKTIIERNKPANVTICEIGCGGGDNLAAIYNWCSKNNVQVQLIGIDIKKECIEFARQQHPTLPATWITNDYNAFTFTKKPSIIFSSLFCHHFTDEDIVLMLHWMQSNSAIGFFINDLHRHPVAYFLIKKLTALLSSSYLVRNDAPLSVARGFKKQELEKLLQNAGISNYSVHWKWAFRYLIICDKYGTKDL